MHGWKSCAVGLATFAVLLPIPPPLGSAQVVPKAEESYSSSIQAEARHITRNFKPDGNLSKDVWKRAKWVEFKHDKSGKYNFPSAATRVAAAWTADFVYFAFSCKYDSLNVYQGEDISKERWELWNRDVAEVFLNPQPENISHYYEFEVAPNNQWIDLEIEKKKDPFNDASWNSGFEHATSIDTGKHVWSLELRI